MAMGTSPHPPQSQRIVSKRDKASLECRSLTTGVASAEEGSTMADAPPMAVQRSRERSLEVAAAETLPAEGRRPTLSIPVGTMDTNAPSKMNNAPKYIQFTRGLTTTFREILRPDPPTLMSAR